MNDPLSYAGDEARAVTDPDRDVWTAPVDRRAMLGLEYDPLKLSPDWNAITDDPDGPGFDPDHRTNPNIPPPVEPEAPAIDFEPLTQAQFEALVRRLMLLRAERDAIAANSEAMCADLDRKIAAELAEWEAPLRHYIDGGYGAKSRRCVYGLAGVRKGGGRPVIVDERLALESVRELAPSALAVNLKRLPPNFTAPGFDVTPETSAVYVQVLPRSRKAKGESEDSDE